MRFFKKFVLPVDGMYLVAISYMLICLRLTSRLHVIFQTKCNIQTTVVELRLSQPRLLERKFSSRLINRAPAD